ncbi:helix-turn-helix transcriptional regulator [Ruania albidiflava]|uniref:helix-turn-helix transcriptional regulator n=1 Tax=Ruania albidiflava TaxID=366586 RepID=UPI0003B6D38E|nr:helix-turn-helix transcriptional regulator [Ruania albidiflava]
MAEPGGQTTFLRAAPALPGMVASVVGYHSTGRTPGVHRGLPSPYLTFILSLDEPITTGRSPEHLASTAAHCNDVLVAGLHSAPAYVHQPVHEAGIQVAVHPLAAPALFGVPARELDLLTIEGADLLGPAVDHLRERLLEEPDWQRRFALLEAYLRCRAQRAETAVRPELTEAWRWLARRRGAGTVGGLAEHVALSERQLRTLFDRELGLGPKGVARLMRFQHASAQIAAGVRTGQEQSLAQVAQQCGYYDQPHLVREFHDLAGIAPSGWVAEERRNIQAGGHRNGPE